MKSDFDQGVEFSHYLLKNHIDKGTTVVDATAGNGYDTLFLADLIGENGFVYGFDIQKKAVEETKNKIKFNDYSDRTRIIWDGHEKMDKYINDKVSGIVFNLGYLPSGDKNIITGPQTTIPAVKKGLTLLQSGGIIVLVIYTGHPGGKKEMESLINFSKNLDYKKYNVLHYHFINQKKSPAQVLAVKYRK
ncbi:MAG: class I SAM-dependent methyltransferase [Bacillota bacterium]